jgi:uncharacterized protein (TIGR02598 family)
MHEKNVSPTKFTLRLRAKGPSAFSLIEVCVAIGIVAFAMMTSVGILPMAMDVFQKAKRDTIHANILIRISGEANSIPFDRLEEIQGARYFDEQGLKVSEAGDSIYTVHVVVADARPLPGQDIGSKAAKEVQLEFEDINQPRDLHHYTVVVANLGK